MPPIVLVVLNILQLLTSATPAVEKIYSAVEPHLEQLAGFGIYLLHCRGSRCQKLKDVENYENDWRHGFPY